MDARLNRRSLALGIPGIILQAAGQFLPHIVGERPEHASAAVVGASWAMLITGGGLLILGLSWYAAAKGHSRAWGLMGLLSIIGLVVLLCLPDRLKAPR